MVRWYGDSSCLEGLAVENVKLVGFARASVVQSHYMLWSMFVSRQFLVFMAMALLQVWRFFMFEGPCGRECEVGWFCQGFGCAES